MPNRIGQLGYKQSAASAKRSTLHGQNGPHSPPQNKKVIGIASLKLAGTGIDGISLAIPIDFARGIIDELRARGRVRRYADECDSTARLLCLVFCFCFCFIFLYIYIILFFSAKEKLSITASDCMRISKAVINCFCVVLHGKVIFPFPNLVLPICAVFIL